MGDLYEVYVCSSTDFPDDKPNEATSNLMPQRSKELYTNAYKRFEKYMLENSISSITENVMLNYMTDLSSKCKCSSLWPTYSMLRSTLNSAHNVDIQTFTNLRAYVKQQSIGYQPKKSKVFTKYDFRRFLCAPDLKYLMHKVVFIFGVAGACHREELAYLRTDNIEDLGKAILIRLSGNTSKPRNFIVDGKYMDFYRKYASLRPPDVTDKRFFWRYHDGKCTRQVVGVHRIGSIPQEIAAYLKLSNSDEYTVRGFRSFSKSFLDDAEADVYAPHMEPGPDIIGMKDAHSWEPPTALQNQDYKSEAVEIKAEVEDEISNDSSWGSSAAAEPDPGDVTKHATWMGTDTASEDYSNVANFNASSAASPSTIEMKRSNRPIIIENCTNCTFNIS